MVTPGHNLTSKITWSHIINWSQLVTAGHCWSQLVTSGHNWSHLDIPCYLVSYPYLVTAGHNWSLLVTSGHNMRLLAATSLVDPPVTIVNLKPGHSWSQLVTPGHGPPHDLSRTEPHPLAKVSGHYLQRLRRSRVSKLVPLFLLEIGRADIAPYGRMSAR